MVVLKLILRRILLLLTIGLSQLPAVFAQSQKGVFDPATVTGYTQAAGLPENTVIDFCFGNLGYMWIATWGGLSRFDGQHFKNDFGYEGGFASKTQIAKLVKKNDDTVYAVTFGQKIFVITNGGIVAYETYSVKRHGILLGNSQVAVPAPAGIYDSNFEAYNRKNNWGIQYTCLGFNYDKDSFGIVGNALSVFTSKGLFKTLPLPAHDGAIFNDNWKIFILENYVVVPNSTAKGFDVYTTRGTIEHLLFPKSIRPWRIYRGTDNHSLFATDGRKLFEIYAAGVNKRIVYTKMLDTYADTLSVNRIYNRDNKYLIISTADKGFFIFHKNAVQTFRAPEKKVYANYMFAQGLMPDDSTRLAGVCFLFDKNGYKGVVNGLKPVYTNDIYYLVNINRLIFKDKKNFYWYTREIKDSFRYDLMKAHYPGSADAVKMATLSKPVYCLLEDNNGNIWLNYNDDLGYFEKGSSQYVNVLPHISKDKYINPLQVNCFLEDDNRRLIIGTTQGVFLLDPQTPQKVFKKYLLDSTEIRFFDLNKRTGSLWIGTYGKGLWVLKKSGELLQVPADRENNLSIVHYAITDQLKRVWFSTNNGLYVTTKKNLSDFETNPSVIPYYYKLSAYDGLAGNELNGACYVPMITQKDGWLSVSTTEGLARLNTNDINFNFPGKTLQIAITQGNKLLKANSQNLDIAAGDNRELVINVMAPDFSPAYNIQLQYRIIKKGERGELGWLDVNEQRRILFPFLATGDYEIQFRKRTGLNNDDFIYHSVTIHKKPFWYQTIYLYPILFIVLMLIGYLVYRWRILSLRKSNIVLTKKIIAATASLKEKNEALLKTVQTRDRLIILFNHDLSTPLFYINRMAQTLAASDKLKNTGAEEMAQLLANSTQDLEELMNEMLLWIQVQRMNATIKLTLQPLNFNELLDKNFNLFQHRLNQNNIQTKILIHDDLTVLADKAVLNSILYNLITNAIKFTENGVVQIEAVNDTWNNDRLCIFVRSKSNTNAIPDVKVSSDYNNINERFNNNTLFENEQSRQIGLQLVKSFSAMLKIDVSVNNSEDGVFSVKIAGLQPTAFV